MVARVEKMPSMLSIITVLRVRVDKGAMLLDYILVSSITVQAFLILCHGGCQWPAVGLLQQRHSGFLRDSASATKRSLVADISCFYQASGNLL